MAQRESLQDRKSRMQERVERMMREQEEKDRAERQRQAQKHRDEDSKHISTKQVVREHCSGSSRTKMSPGSIEKFCTEPLGSSPRGSARSPRLASYTSPPHVSPQHSTNTSSPASPQGGRFTRLCQALEAEAETRASRAPASPPPRLRPDRKVWEDVPLEETHEFSPTSGKMVLSEWDRMSLTPPDEIIPGFMWLGQERSFLVQEQLGFDCWSHCLFATNKPVSPYQAREYHCIQLNDTPDADLQAYFEEANAFIEQAHRDPNSRLLVHCRMGQSRSTTLVAAYLMAHYRCSLKDALLHIKKRRDLICPNTGFFVQLQKYEKELFGNPQPSFSRDAARKAGCCSVSKLGWQDGL